MEKHICIVCKKTKTIEIWRWRETDDGYICGNCVYCEGCKKYHPPTMYMTTRKGKWYCDKWVKKPAPTMAQKMKGLSPEEVMSGVHLGADRDPVYGNDTEDYHVEVSEGMRQLGEELSQ